MKKNYLKAGFLGLLVSVLLTQSTWAQSDPSGKRRVTGTYAITNTTLFSSPGQPGSKGTVLIKDGVILGVGSAVQIPKDAKIIAGDSLFVYAGFIDGAGNMGVAKPKDPEKPKEMVNSNPPDEVAGITPWRSVTDDYSGSATLVNDWRKAGFTISQLLPEGGMIPGKAAIMILGDEQNTNLMQANTAMAANFRGSRGMYPSTAVGVMAKFREVYQNTFYSLEHEKMFASTPGVKRPQVTPTQAGMAPVVQKQIPVIFQVSNDLEARRAISLQKELGFKLVLTGLENYENIIDLIKSTNTPVMIKLEIPDDKAIKAQKEEGVTEDTKAQYARVKEAYEKSLKQATLLEKAGIPFAFSTIDTKAADAHKALKTLVENGLSEKAALAALTTNPASILGISRVAGTIEKGKIANLVLLTDSLFKENAQVKHVVADGYVFDYEVKKKSPSTNGKTDNPGTTKIDGIWEYTSESPGGTTGGEMVLKKEGADYTGSISYNDPAGSGKMSSPIKNVNLTGNRISFDFDVAAGGMNLTVTISGEVSGSSMEGTMSVAQLGSFPLSAKLASPSLKL
jgi:hypothetical protein